MEARVGPGAREAVFAQLADAGRAEQVAQRLTDGIVLGVLHPGERLPSEPELARRFGVALITVREGLGILREAGLVETRRGRDGGSFVAPDEGGHRSLLATRLRGLAQVELSDMAVYFGAILAGSAERAAERAADGDGARLGDWLAAADFGTAASARTNQGGFFLEVAVLSQSARLVREQIRLQAEFGPLLLLGLDDEGTRADVVARDRAIVRAVTAHRPAKARDAAGELVRILSERLLAAKARIERGGGLDEPISA
jgi:DNA-binding FadR family transcriptional regulator